MRLVIDERSVRIIRNERQVFSIGSIKNALGNILTTLDFEFPGLVKMTGAEYGQAIIERLRRKLDGADPAEKCKVLWGLKVSVDDAYNLLNLPESIRGGGKIDLSLHDVEIWRVRNSIIKAIYPHSAISVDYSQGLEIYDAESLYDVVYGLLFFYAFNGMKLVKCEHCGRWFATDTFKNKYCNRKSQFPGYEHLNCEQAVRNIFQQCGRMKNRIETKARQREPITKFEDEFRSNCESLYLTAKGTPTIENLSAYLTFLRKTEKEGKWRKK